MTFLVFFDSVYLPAHRKPLTRYLHFTGTTLVIIFGLTAIATNEWWWVIGMPVAGYGFAWPAHWYVEHNQPETLVDFPHHVAQSLGGNLAMFILWCIGALGDNLAQSRQKYPGAWR